MESYYRNIMEDANNNIQHLNNINNDSKHLLDWYGHNWISHRCCRRQLRGQHRQPLQKERHMARSRFLRISMINRKICLFFLNMRVLIGRQCNLGLPCFWKSEDKEKGHLWQKESSARSVSNIFLWQPAGSPPSPWSPQHLPFPDALSKPGTG